MRTPVWCSAGRRQNDEHTAHFSNPHDFLADVLHLCLHACVCVCVCERERDLERWRVCVWVCVCVRVCVCATERVCKYSY